MNTADADGEGPDNNVKPNTYVHQIMTDSRKEPVHNHANKRNVKITLTQLPTKNMHEKWKKDNSETFQAVYKSDYS